MRVMPILELAIKQLQMQKKGWVTAFGFSMFILGFLSIVLSMVGVQLQFMTWLDHFGRGWGFLVRLILMMAGILMVIIDRSAPVD